MELNKMLHNRETQSQPAVCSGRRAVSLTETIKNEGQKLRTDSNAGIFHGNVNPRRVARHANCYQTSLRREFDRVAKEIPKDLL
jgi:hypothetical protein